MLCLYHMIGQHGVRGLVAVAVLAILGAPGAAAASTSPAAVYALDGGVCCSGSPGAIWQFKQSSTGSLTPLTPASMPAQYPRDIAISPDGKSVYVTEAAQNNGSGFIAQFSVGADGVLKPMSTPTVAAGKLPGAIVASPNGKYVYAEDSSNGVILEYDVNPGGALTQTQSTSGSTVCGAAGTDLAITPSSNYVYLARNNPGCSYSIAHFTAAGNGWLTEGTDPSTPNAVDALAISPDGKSLYAATGFFGGNQIYQFDIGSDGTLVAKNPASVSTESWNAEAMAISPDGRNLYLTADQFTGKRYIDATLRYAVGASGLAGSPTSYGNGGTANFSGLGFSGDGRSLYVLRNTTAGGSLLQYNVLAGGGLTPKSPSSVAAGGNMVGLVASPAPPQHTLSVSKTGSGTVTSSPTGINCGKTCSAQFAGGTKVTLTARPATGSAFAGWSGGACKGVGVCALTISADRKVSARFVPKPPTLRLVGSPGPTSSGVVIKLACTGTSGQSCPSTDTLTTTAAPPKLVGKKAATIPRGKTETITVSLNSTGQAMLKRSHKLTVILTVTLTYAHKTTTSAKRTVTIRAK